jgi:hypothetical protein
MSSEPKAKRIRRSNCSKKSKNEQDMTASLSIDDVVLNGNVFHHILSFIHPLLYKNSNNNDDDWAESPERCCLVQDFSIYRSVSKTFRDATWELMSVHGAPTQVVSVSQLAKIKSEVAGLDLSSLHKEFLKEI